MGFDTAGELIAQLEDCAKTVNEATPQTSYCLYAPRKIAEQISKMREQLPACITAVYVIPDELIGKGELGIVTMAPTTTLFSCLGYKNPPPLERLI